MLDVPVLFPLGPALYLSLPVVLRLPPQSSRIHHTKTKTKTKTKHHEDGKDNNTDKEVSINGTSDHNDKNNLDMEIPTENDGGDNNNNNNNKTLLLECDPLGMHGALAAQTALPSLFSHPEVKNMNELALRDLLESGSGAEEFSESGFDKYDNIAWQCHTDGIIGDAHNDDNMKLKCDMHVTGLQEMHGNLPAQELLELEQSIEKLNLFVKSRVSEKQKERLKPIGEDQAGRLIQSVVDPLPNACDLCAGQPDKGLFIST